MTHHRYDTHLEECDRWIASMENSIRNFAWTMWDHAGRPDGQSDRFWHEAVMRHRVLWYNRNGI